MIRLIQRRLIIPRGDTGSFSIPINNEVKDGDIAVFSIYDPMTRLTVFEKEIELTEGLDTLNISLTHSETDIIPKKYLWDIKIYNNPVRDEDDVLIDGDEINSYYAAFSLPICEIREVAKQ